MAASRIRVEEPFPRGTFVDSSFVPQVLAITRFEVYPRLLGVEWNLSLLSVILDTLAWGLGASIAWNFTRALHRLGNVTDGLLDPWYWIV